MSRLIMYRNRLQLYDDCMTTERQYGMHGQLVGLLGTGTDRATYGRVAAEENFSEAI